MKNKESNKWIMHRLIRSLNIRHGEPLGVWTFKNWSVKISAPGAKIMFQYPTQVLDLLFHTNLHSKLNMKPQDKAISSLIS